MITLIGNFLSIINKANPKLAHHWRGCVLATIMSQNTFGFMQKLSVLNRAERFLGTMSKADKDRLVSDMNLPKWSKGDLVDGSMRAEK